MNKKAFFISRQLGHIEAYNQCHNQVRISQLDHTKYRKTLSHNQFHSLLDTQFQTYLFLLHIICICNSSKKN